jgi:hypothetical protein
MNTQEEVIPVRLIDLSLRNAVNKKDLQKIQQLILSGADVDCMNHSGFAPVFYAVYAGILR